MPNPPNMVERKAKYSSALDLNKLRMHLELGYEQSPNENNLIALKMVIEFQRKIRDDELSNVAEDLRELFNHPYLYSQAAVVWAKMEEKEEWRMAT